MHSKKFLFPLFIVLALIQLYVPIDMIMKRELVLEQGEEYKFRIEPIDPADPIRGQYLVLSFPDNRWLTDTLEQWREHESVYAILDRDSRGFAFITRVQKERPETSAAFISAHIRHTVRTAGRQELILNFPFDRFYIQESKARCAEEQMMEAARDESKQAYALVWVRTGEPVLSDVMIDDVPIREICKQD